MKRPDRTEEHRQHEAQEKPQPGEEEAEVVAGGGEDGVDGIALGSSQIIALHAMLILDVADERFDCGAAPHLAFDGGRHAAFLACRVDFERVVEWRIVAAISGVNENTVDVIADHGFHLGDQGRQRQQPPALPANSLISGNSVQRQVLSRMRPLPACRA